MNGEYDYQLHWPVKVKVQLELLNQAGDHHNVVRTGNREWAKWNSVMYLKLMNI